MTARVLQHEGEIAAARNELVRSGFSALAPNPISHRILRRLGLLRTPRIGDPRKSWDVHLSAEFIDGHVQKSATLVDVGAYASEIPYVLKRMGFRSIVGIDLAADLECLPAAPGLRYVRGDFLRSPLRGGSCDAITAISVIEHGFDGEAWLREASRILRPGGFFIASCDYWPDKLDTRGITAFGLDWRIFSHQEVLEFIDRAAHYDLHPAGPIELAAADRVIRWNEREYTFAWMVLRKGSL